MRASRLRLTKISEHTKNIIQAESQLRTFLFRPNVFKMNSINTDKIFSLCSPINTNDKETHFSIDNGFFA